MTTRTKLALALLLAAPLAQAEEKFATPEAAADALVKAFEAKDQPRLDRLLGPDYRAFHEGQMADAALAASRRDRFVAAYREFHRWAPAGDDKRVLYVGAEGWPVPIPLVRKGGRWAFDGRAGVEELRNRIVGENELNAIAALDYYGAAQRAYSADDHDGDGALEYAQRFTSGAGKRDGLHWEDDADDPEGLESPLGPLLALAELAMGERGSGAPFLGYRFRILTAQGPAGKAGAYDYVVNGHMVAGYAAVAWPADYGDTGVMTFMVNQDGVVYEHDLGEKTADAVAAITRFDPGDGWVAVDDDNLLGESTAAAGAE
jgi:hypothetical protein